MLNDTHTFFASCPRGLEPVLTAELERLGAGQVRAGQGGVAFSGEFAMCYRVNLDSRIASRVLWKIYHGRYRDEEEIYTSVFALPWSDWFSEQETIKVKVSAQHCPLKSLDFVTLRIKDAMCDKFKVLTQRRPSVNTHQPSMRIEAFLRHQEMTLYLDTSGEPLFKRGLRKSSGEAPMRENLAAGIIGLSGWAPGQPFLDPMCGSGTLLMEAAQIARNISPGLGRRFAFENLRNFDVKAWRALCDASRASQSPGKPLQIDGYDRDGIANKAAETNLRAAGFAEV